MRYEEMKAEPRDQAKRLAEFLGCPFTTEENGLVDEILDFCSLRNLSSLEVNKTKIFNKLDRSILFREGEVGDWKNYLTPEMENKLDMIIQEKLQGSACGFRRITQKKNSCMLTKKKKKFLHQSIKQVFESNKHGRTTNTSQKDKFNSL
ncbi:unnamed protein product [Brassica oleracea]